MRVKGFQFSRRFHGVFKHHVAVSVELLPKPLMFPPGVPFLSPGFQQCSLCDIDALVFKQQDDVGVVLQQASSVMILTD
jgi:hypothetical protein